MSQESTPKAPEQNQQPVNKEQANRALNVVAQTCRAYRGSFDEHLAIQNAVQVLSSIVAGMPEK